MHQLRCLPTVSLNPKTFDLAKDIAYVRIISVRQVVSIGQLLVERAVTEKIMWKSCAGLTGAAIFQAVDQLELTSRCHAIWFSIG